MTRMTIEELERRLRDEVLNPERLDYWDTEERHREADALLIEYIGSESVKLEYEDAGFYYT